MNRLHRIVGHYQSVNQPRVTSTAAAASSSSVLSSNVFDIPKDAKAKSYGGGGENLFKTGDNYGAHRPYVNHAVASWQYMNT
jgi:hypothetical protein